MLVTRVNPLNAMLNRRASIERSGVRKTTGILTICDTRRWRPSWVDFRFSLALSEFMHRRGDCDEMSRNRAVTLAVTSIG